jgi:hypothetical protein
MCRSKESGNKNIQRIPENKYLLVITENTTESELT